MIDVSFDKPYLLLLAVPLLLLVLIPFFFAVGRKSKSPYVSLGIHLALALLVTLVAAGMSVTRIMTQTYVYVVADGSYSAEKNAALVDDYIRQVEQGMPKNSKLGVVVFGKDQVLHTPVGEKFLTVAGAAVDSSGTDIKSALLYAGELFPEDVVRRIVLITDGKQTAGDSFDGVVGAVEALYERGIYVDAIYLDDNLKESDCEVQITDVELTPTTYLNHLTTADVLLQSAAERVNATVTLYAGDRVVEVQYPTLTRGYNVLNFELPTDTEGRFDYRVEVQTEKSAATDGSPHNNAYTFTQIVSGKLNVLLITDSAGDVERARALYGENAVIDVYLKDPDVPCTVEALIKYDEILLSGVDVRKLNNVKSFLSCLDVVVSRYGKSLMTFGDIKIQNQSDDMLQALEDMLPVRYGNKDQDAKLLCMVIDTSRSMEFVEKLDTAKQAALQLLDILNDQDFLIIVTFSGDHTTIWRSAPVGGNRERIAQLIREIKPTQGTVLGKAMAAAAEQVLSSTVEDKQMFLISDGRTWTNEEDNAVDVARDMLALGVPTSVLNIGTRVLEGDEASAPALQLLRDIAKEGAGNYYYAANPRELEEIMLTDIANDVTETVIEGNIPLSVRVRADRVLQGIETALPNVGGYVYAKAKESAITVLTVDFTTISGKVKAAPLYAYWGYGNGKVSTFTSAFSGAWVEGWETGEGERLMKNMTKVSVPKEKIDHPFAVETEREREQTRVTILPATLNFEAVVTAVLTLPDGARVEKQLIFNTDSYVYEFETPACGKYAVKITYAYANRVYEKEIFFHVPYAAEYDSFAVYHISDIHKLIRNRGSVLTPGSISLTNREGDVATYTFYCTMPFMIAAVALFVLDVMVRKLRPEDIRNLFGLKERRQHEKKGGAAK